MEIVRREWPKPTETALGPLRRSPECSHGNDQLVPHTAMGTGRSRSAGLESGMCRPGGRRNVVRTKTSGLRPLASTDNAQKINCLICLMRLHRLIAAL